MTDRLLVYVPTYGSTARDETLAGCAALQFDGNLDLEIADGRELFGESPKPANLLAQQRRAWDMAIGGDYSALVFIEHDMMPLPWAAQSMWDMGKPVVYAPYAYRHGKHNINIMQYVNDKNIGMSLTNYPTELAKARKKRYYKCSGMSWGFTLIRREVLRKIRPRVDEQNKYTDLLFAKDCLRADIEQWSDLSLTSLHYEPQSEKWISPWAVI
jgi:hypothetical protein